MKRLILITFIIYIFMPVYTYSHFDMTIPVEGNSIANDELQYNIVKKLYKYYSPKYPACSDFSIKDTQIIHYPYDVKKKKNQYVKGYWKELWTLNICGNYKQIPISFHINNKSTIFHIDDYFLKE